MTKLAGSVSSEKTLGMLEDLLCKLRKGALTERQLDKFLKKENPFAEPKDILAEWEEFYREVFGFREVDFSNLHIPPERDGFGWLIVVQKGLTANQIFDKLTARMKTYRYANDLDKVVPTNCRETRESYAVWIRDRVEADEELKGLSANDLVQKAVNCITLPERLLLSLFYFWKSRGGQLDLKNWTQCTGSRDSHGLVPCVYFRVGKLRVNFYNPDGRSGNIRARTVVS